VRTALSEQDRSTIEGHLRSFNKIQAILVVRQATGVGLNEAMGFLAEFERQLDPPIARENADVGMTAQVLAIGAFREDLAEHLAYPAQYYANTRPGVPVIHFLFECFGSSQSHELAACFAIDPWDFNQHKLDPDKVDLGRLRATFPEDEQQQFASFLVLREACFDFYYLPNG